MAVSVWYKRVKDEPRARPASPICSRSDVHGLGELPGDFFEYLQAIGATDYNGTTGRPPNISRRAQGALERALFMESEAWLLLGAITQEKDQQIGASRTRSARATTPRGCDYEVLANLFPDGHPYQHDTIGSMADLDSATLADVKQWFIDKYAPNNAVIVLAGDINAAEARPLVEKYFGAIERGPVNNPAEAAVPTLAAPKAIVMKDRVAAVQLQRHWAVPGINSQQLAALDLGGSILGGLASSRLDQILVREEKLAVAVTAGMQPFQRVGLFQVTATVKPGVDPAIVDRRLNEIMAEYLANGPTEDEVRRAATQDVASRIRGLEQVGGFGGKAVALAEGKVFTGDSDFYKSSLNQYASVTAADVRAAMQQWLSRPAFHVRLEPGERPPYVEPKGAKADKVDVPSTRTVRPVPPLAQTPPLDFPDVMHTVLSNGVQVHYAQRGTIPATQLALTFDAGFSADAKAGRGLQNLTLSLLEEGADGMTSQQIAEAQERLGAVISASGSSDRSTVSLSALTANLGPSLDLLADVVQRPDFVPAEVERVKTQTLTAISQAQKEPNAMASRALPALLYGEDHPYATTSLGEVAAVTAFNRDDLKRFHDSWLGRTIWRSSLSPHAGWPNDAGARAALRDLDGAGGAEGRQDVHDSASRPAKPKIVLSIDRPGSPQSVILVAS